MTKFMIRCPVTGELVDTGYRPKSRHRRKPKTWKDKLAEVFGRNGNSEPGGDEEEEEPSWSSRSWKPRTMTCPACGQEHIWTPAETFLQLE